MPRRQTFALLIASLCSLALTPVAQAAAVRWAAAASGNWNVAANWSPATIPTAADTAVIDVAGTYTVTVNQNLAIAGLRVSGAASGTQTVTAVSRTMTFSGPVSLGAQSVSNWTSCTVNGAGAITSEGTLNLSAGSIAQAFTNSGTLAVTGGASQNGALTTTSGSTLRVSGTAAANGAYTVANGFTNNAAIELTSTGAATAATLAVTNGTLVNAAGAQISSLAGSGGARNLTARLDNQGTITVSQALATNKGSAGHSNSGTIDVTGGDYTITLSGASASFTTNGAINVSAGRTINLNGNVSLGTGLNYIYSGGTLGGAGSVSLLNATLSLSSALATSVTHLDGTTATISGLSSLTVSSGTTLALSGCNLLAPTIVESGGKLSMLNSDLNGATTNNGLIEWSGSCSQSNNFTSGAGSTLRVLATAASNAALTCAGGLTNNSVIELTSSGAATAASLIVNGSPLVNSLGAQINSLAGSGGARNLTAALDNRGTITVSQAMTTNKGSVAHSNTGTIDVTGANYTVVLSGSGASFTTSGAINVPLGRTLTLQGNVSLGTGLNYYYAGGTLGGAGTVALLNSTLNLTSGIASSMAHLDGTTSTIAGPGTLTVSTGTTVTMSSCNITAPTAVENGGTLEMTASDQTGPITNAGTTVWIGACTAPGAITTVGGSTLRVQANASGNAALTVANGFTNNATIELTSTGAATVATLAVTSGILVNAAGAQINSLPGSGGARNLTARFDNQGTITISQNTTTNKGSVAHVNGGTIDVTGGNYTIVLSGTGASLTTTGAMNVASGRTLTLQGNVSLGTNLDYFYNGGTLGGAGTVSVLNATLDLNVPLSTLTTNLTATTSTVAGPSTLTVASGTSFQPSSCTISAPTVVQAGGTFQLTSCDVTGALTNAGTTVWMGTCTESVSFVTVAGSTMRVLGTTSTNADLLMSNGFTNTAVIELTSSGGATSAVLQVLSGTLTNAPGAQINSLAGSAGSRSLHAQLDNQGTINIAQALVTSRGSVDHLNSGTINVSGGNYTIVLSGITPSFTNTGTMSVAAGRTLTLQGNITGGAGLDYFHNGGTLGGAGTVAVTNASLHLGLAVSTSFTNLTGSNAEFDGPDTLYVDGGAPALTSCSMNGPVVCTAGTLSLTACDTHALLALRSGGTVEWHSASTFDGAFVSLPGSVARLLGSATTAATLTATVPMTNNALLEMSSIGAATSSILTLNGTFTNGPNGTVRALAGAGGARQLLCALDNQGLFEVQQNLSLSRATAAHANSGTTRVSASRILTVSGASFTNTPSGTLAGDGTITMSGATSLIQSGTVSPGASPGRLAFTAANYPCVATSVYNVEVGGDSPATGYDQIAMSGATQLAGTLNISLVGGYLPTPGRRYVVATFPSRTGTFSTVNGLAYGPGQMWAVAYSDTDVVLLAMDQTWTRLFPLGGAPQARDGHTAVLDSTGDRMIVFGGRTDAGPRNDVWVLTHATSGGGSQWLALAPSGTPPAPRTNASAVYDAAGNRMIVYGGDDAAGSPTVFGDTWVLTNANGLGGTPAWIQLAPGSAPPARSAHGAAYDHVNNRMMLFGGTATPATCGGALADAWVLEHANGLGGTPAWTLVYSAPPGPSVPSARVFAGVAYDAELARLVVVGGDDGCGTASTQGWLLDGANGLSGPAAWSAIAASPASPAGWSGARYAYDAVYKWVDGFGGMFGAEFSDTSFTLTGANLATGGGWVRRAFWGTRPAPRAYHSMVVSSANHVAVVFGGSGASGRLDDLFRRDIDRGDVLAVDPPATPPAGHALTTAFAMPPSPNPARGDVAFAVDVARDQRVDLAVFDLAGRRVTTLHSGTLAAGRHAFRWSGSGDGGPAAPGIYLVRFHAEDREQVVRMVRLK